jgi:hypothetical protein
MNITCWGKNEGQTDIQTYRVSDRYREGKKRQTEQKKKYV